jgi:MoaA/NifB/PqqE/SkfB family radical SAM enzyme
MMKPELNVIDFVVERNKRGLAKHDPYYQMNINRMSKIELLEEMVRFQEERSAKSILSLTMMVRGRILFRALETQAETDELRLLASSYRRHLEHEIESELKEAPVTNH